MLGLFIYGYEYVQFYCIRLIMDNFIAEQYLLSKPETSKDYPFGADVMVFKVKNKMFATLSLGTGNEKDTQGKMKGHYCMNLKCDPDEAVMLRDIFSSVIPGYHMNKIINYNNPINN